MDSLEERLDALEQEHEVLSARVEMLTNFLMNAIALLAENEDTQALREGIERLIVTSRKAGIHDTLNDAQDLLRSFELVMRRPGA